MSKILTHHVTKAFEDDGVQRLPGECVDALPWRTAMELERQRYIQPLPEGVQPVGDNEGRWWLGPEWLARHKRTPMQTVQEAVQGALPDVEKVGVALYRLPDGTKFRGSKREAREAAAQLVGA
ncbi:MAG: hypothetical protein WC718_07260 [Phycisphaerales bacterium]|jgi:hypothetical protein